MYLLIIILPILLLLFCVNHFRRRRSIRKVRALCANEKYALLNEIIEPFGYSYVSAQDIFTTRPDAFQREFGYCALYDKAAFHFNLIFDSLPVYFNYRGRTWLMEFWKGQYGINTGGEIGLYYADRILSEDELKTTLFQTVDDADMVRMSLSITRNDKTIAQLTARHWWLTAFRMGCFSKPSDLSLQASVTFPTCEMANAFLEGLSNTGYPADEICCCCNTVNFDFVQSTRRSGIFRRLRIRLAQWSNRFWCRMFLFVTRPFNLSADRLLYLYYYLPFAFRKMLRIRKYRGRK